MSGQVVRIHHIVARAGPGDYAVLDPNTETVVYRCRSESAALRWLMVRMKPAPEPLPQPTMVQQQMELLV